MSLFVTFEGCEGCGKTFQSKALFKRFSSAGISAWLTYEPGGTPLGDEIRRLVKRQRLDVISPEVELLLFATCRFHLVNKVIRPRLEEGKIVICDRFSDSTTAYQGYGRGIDLDIVGTINSLATQGIKPDLTILLDIPVREGLVRKKGGGKDRFEGEGLDFHRRVRNGYLKVAAQEPERWMVIDARLPKAGITETIWRQVNYLLSQRQDLGEDA